MRTALLFVILALVALLAHVHQVNQLQEEQGRLLRSQNGLLRDLASAHAQVADLRGTEAGTCERTLDELLAHLGVEEPRPRVSGRAVLVNREVGPPEGFTGIGGDDP